MKSENNFFVQMPFYTPPARAEAFAQLIKRFAPKNTNNILDVGCGCGDLVFELAKLFPKAKITGNDVSVPNINTATSRIASVPGGAAENVVFVHDDYLSLSLPANDLLVSYSCLNLIPRSLDDIVEKLSRDVAVNGKLIFSMPNDSVYNRVLIFFRKILRLLRCKLSDKLIFKLARFLLDDSISDEQIERNIVYMYVVPENLYCRKFRKKIARNGFNVEFDKQEESESFVKLRHSVVVLKKIGNV